MMNMINFRTVNFTIHGEGGGSRNRDSSINENVIWLSDEYVLWDIFNSKVQECSPYFSASSP